MVWSKWTRGFQISGLVAVVLLSPSPSPAQATKTVRLWTDTTVPAIVDGGDTDANELGMRFRSLTAGSVTGVKFYKSVANTGTHSGSLWSNTGTLLATVTFTNETASGWQSATFSAPVPIQANVTYVISYHMNGGHFSMSDNYFAATNGGVFSDPLLALASGVDGLNAVYKQGATGFPTQNYGLRNYWVDPIVTIPDTGSTTKLPAAVVVQTGTLSSGNAASLTTDENTYYSLNSTTTGTRTSAWYGSFTNIPVGTPRLVVNYKGKNSRSCTEVVSIYNWITSAWETLDSRAVTTTEVLRAGLTPAGTMANFVSDPGEVRVRVSCSTTANFTTSADSLSLTWDPTGPKMTMTSPTSGQTIVGDTFTATYVNSGDLVSAQVSHAHLYLDSNAVVMDIPMDGAYTFIGVPPGPHTIRGILAKSNHVEIPGTDSATISFQTSLPDLTPPSVSITFPSEGTTVSGTVMVSAAASDNAAVAGVQFLMDGNNLGVEDTVAPYAISFSANSFSAGAHVLTARARDTSNNTALSANRNIVTALPDTTFPSVSMTAPAQATTITGTTLASADASDNIGVVGVQFRMDGANLSAEDTAAPYEISFDANAFTSGAHILTAAARDAAGNVTVSANRNITINAPPDTTFPTISITAPAEGTSVSTTATVTATAADNVGVVGVQFLIDGANLGAEDTSSPYSISLNPTLYAAGAHVLTASARDAAGNATLSAIRNITIVNPNDPAAVGQWSASQSWPAVGVHTAIMHTGKVLVFEGVGIDGQGRPGGVWDPATGTFLQIADPISDIFCASHSALPDGRILVVGGHSTDGHIGIWDVNIFNPVTQSWSVGPHMAYRRWYPTSTTMPDGRVLLVSGADITDRDYIPIPEIYNPLSNTWTSLTAASKTLPAYGHVFVLPDGKVAYTGSDEAKTGAYKLDVSTQTWTDVTATAVDGGSSVMYDYGKFMKSGTAPDDLNIPTPTAAKTTYVIDYNSPTPSWQQTADMGFQRTYHNLTLLPDGKVISTSGSQRIDKTQPVFDAEMWNPATMTWTTLSKASVARTYHSNALLLPDARMLISGSGRLPGMVDQRNYEIFSPPYLFKGARPVISSVPTLVNYASSFFVGTPDGAAVTSVVLMRPGSMTHEIDMEQRRVPVTFSQTSGGLDVIAPPNGNIAPPGYYMLFLLNANGVPSVAQFVRLPAPYEDNQAPSQPTGLSALGAIGTASLSWTASTDNNGVTLYNVHRSTVSGFVPSAANRVAQPAGPAYADSGLAAGLYYYKVTAQDANGNLSAPSNEATASVSADVAAPNVSMSAPLPGAAVTGTITVSADASDDVGVAGVQFLLDGTPLMAEDTSAPYTIQWNTASTLNGTHQLAAKARDTGGNLATSQNVSVSVSNSGPVGAVALYAFEEASGSSATDSSGNQNTGSIAAATRVAGKYGSALSFNGTSAMVSIPGSASLNLSSAMTAMAWVNPKALGNWRTILMKEVPGDENWTMYGSDTASRPRLGLRAGGNFYGMSGPAALALNTWSHVAMTYDGSVWRLYVNGTQVTSQNVTGAIGASTSPLRIGGNGLWGEYFSGLIDEVRVYNRALTVSEVQQSMNTPIVQ
jgi:hypothetical protein